MSGSGTAGRSSPGPSRSGSTQRFSLHGSRASGRPAPPSTLSETAGDDNSLWIDGSLRQEVERLRLYRAIVSDGPDLFSLHSKSPDALFSFVSEDFRRRMNVALADVVGRPLASIVDPRYRSALRTELVDLLDADKENVVHGEGGRTVELRVAHGDLSFQASMSMSIGTQGIIVVTRLYGDCA